jgi:hypothetical protein
MDESNPPPPPPPDPPKKQKRVVLPKKRRAYTRTSVDLKLLEKFPVGNIVNFHSDQ